MIPKLGAVRCGLDKPISFVRTKGKQQIYDAMLKSGMNFDSFGEISGKEVNSYLNAVGKTVKRNFTQVNPENTFKYLTAHGANQIVDGKGTEIISFVENIKHPLKEVTRCIKNMLLK